MENAYAGQLFMPEEGSDPGAPWPARSRTVDRMLVDHNAALMRGLLLPGRSRGESIMRFWGSRFQALDPEAERPWGEGRPAPLAMLNTSAATTGSRLVGGRPPVPAGLLAAGRPTLALQDPGGAILTLPEMVRASSAFPFGVDLPVLQSKLAGALQACADQNPNLAESCVEQVLVSDRTGADWELPAGRTRLADGGVTDNSGLMSMAALFDGIAAHPTLVQELLAGPRGLRARGVVLLEIDSGARPKPAARVSPATEGLTLPLVAINYGGYARERQAAQHYLCGIRRAIDGDDAPCEWDAPCSSVQHVAVRYDPTCPRPLTRGVTALLSGEHWYEGPDARVATTWSLSPAQKQRLMEIYEVQRVRLAGQLDGAFRRLGAVAVDPEALSRLRAERWQVEAGALDAKCTLTLRDGKLEALADRALCSGDEEILLVPRDRVDLALPEDLEINEVRLWAGEADLRGVEGVVRFDAFAADRRSPRSHGPVDEPGLMRVRRVQWVVGPALDDPEEWTNYLLLQGSSELPEPEVP